MNSPCRKIALVTRSGGNIGQASAVAYAQAGPAHEQELKAVLPVQILFVCDDMGLRHQIVSYLHNHNMRVHPISGYPDIAARLSGGEPGLIILDQRPGGQDALELLRAIRSHSDVPVILMTQQTPDNIEGIIGLELGADDTVSRAFNSREFLARVRALLRRDAMTRRGIKRARVRGGYRFAGWQLQLRSRRLIDPKGIPVALTKGEFALLVAFLASARCPLTREQLLSATRLHEDVFDRSIDVQVLRLRRKLESDPAKPQFIKTERGLGYMFAVTVEAY